MSNSNRSLHRTTFLSAMRAARVFRSTPCLFHGNRLLALAVLDQIRGQERGLLSRLDDVAACRRTNRALDQIYAGSYVFRAIRRPTWLSTAVAAVKTAGGGARGEVR